MADWYVWSGGSGAGGTSWATAYTTLAAACTAKAAGDTFFVAHDHAESGAAAANVTIVSPGTEVTACKIFCVNRAGSVPPVAADLRTTATITSTTTGAILLQGSVAECYGITFNCGTGSSTVSLNAGSSAGRSWRFVNCKFRLPTTSNSARIQFGAGATVTILENCTVQFAAIAQGITVNTNRLVIRNTTAGAFVVGSIPTVLFLSAGPNGVMLEGVDLSASGAGKTLFTAVGGWSADNVLKDCKLGASVTVIGGTYTGGGGARATVIRSDSGDTNYRSEYYNIWGSQTVETTIVRSGGASDGTTPIAWKIVTTASTIPVLPFECLPISLWNETVGSPLTVTLQGIWGDGVVPTNADIWIEVEYLGTSGSCLGNRATSGEASMIETAANLPAGSGTWGGSTTPFAMSATVTPQEKGPITIYVKATKSAATFYIDPKPVIS